LPTIFLYYHYNAGHKVSNFEILSTISKLHTMKEKKKRGGLNQLHLIFGLL